MREASYREQPDIHFQHELVLVAETRAGRQLGWATFGAVNTFLEDECDEEYDETEDDESLRYNKKCDTWSLGVIAYILLCGYAPFQGCCGAACGWERGEGCTRCQDILFSNIKQARLVFPADQWTGISAQAKDLIQRLLVKDSAARLTAEQILAHPWILHQGSAAVLHTPVVLSQRQEAVRTLEEFASKILEASRTLETAASASVASDPVTIPAPARRRPALSFNLSPVDSAACNLLQRRRRKSKELFSKFLSIDELETDFFMKAIS